MGIKIKINSDGIWGDTEMGGINECASEDKLEQMVADAVAAEYGDVEVSVEQVGRTIVTGVEDDEKELILDIVSETWQTWEWVVEEEHGQA
jgi:hypothetical protein